MTSPAPGKRTTPTPSNRHRQNGILAKIRTQKALLFRRGVECTHRMFGDAYASQRDACTPSETTVPALPVPPHRSGPGWRLRGIISPLIAVALQTAYAGTGGDTAQRLRFNRDIRPVLTAQCIACHGPDAGQRKAGLRLDIREEALRTLESGNRAIVPGNPEASALIQRVESTDRDEVMPPPKSHKALSTDQKQLLKQWIREGAAYEPHWAFVPPVRPTLPEGGQTHPVDAFIRRDLQHTGLEPSPEADRSTLIRRVTLDLTGLPPTRDELAAFLHDANAGAYERLVDRLMSSRAYAERRAQDWLDLARYADTCGFADDMKQDIWPYRDWVVDALHQNMPYDRFTIEQLAGDMLPSATESQRIATGFHRNAPQAKGNTYPVEEYRLKGVADRVNTTGRVWFGLTIGCAECHDHKFDPISQRDYYALFAIFNNVVHGGAGFTQGGPLLEMPTPEQKRAVQETAEALERFGKDSALDERQKTSKKELQKQLDRLKSSVLSVPVMQELETPRQTFIHIRGDFLQKGDSVQAAPPRMFCTPGEAPPSDRLAFARWLVNGRHPLVARVAVNRFWQGYFGEGLVRTPDDFGLHGDTPVHPDLLDWLASEFVAKKWDMKHIHRLIVTSATYKQDSRCTPTMLDRDPKNQMLARAPRMRLAAEQLRDQALAVSGLLNRTEGGPPVFPVQPAGYWEQRALKGKWTPSTDTDRHRRSLYTYWRRMALHPTMELLDAPARVSCTAKRPVSNVPTQALVLLNDPIFFEAAEAFAHNLLSASPQDSGALVERAFEDILARKPSPAERQKSLTFLAETRRHTPTPQGPTDPDLHAWTLLANALFNLDETLVRP